MKLKNIKNLFFTNITAKFMNNKIKIEKDLSCYTIKISCLKQITDITATNIDCDNKKY